MRKPPANPTEQECPACNGTGYLLVGQPARPGRKIYPPPCNKCGGPVQWGFTATAPPGPARHLRVFLSADCLGARSPRRFSIWAGAVVVIITDGVEAEDILSTDSDLFKFLKGMSPNGDVVLAPRSGDNR
jgi:hypothetical protein